MVQSVMLPQRTAFKAHYSPARVKRVLQSEESQLVSNNFSLSLPLKERQLKTGNPITQKVICATLSVLRN